MDNIDEAIKKLLSTTDQKLVLLNDDHNSFDNIIMYLVVYLFMDKIQAEQCATIVHHKGEYVIKSGEQDELIRLRDRLMYHRVKTVIR